LIYVWATDCAGLEAPVRSQRNLVPVAVVQVRCAI
jgi:hypothetical protein